jgi:predicted DNA-binding protein
VSYLKAMPFSVRLDPETESMIARLARESGKSRSFVVREAVVRYASTVDADKSAYERLKPLIGAIRSGRTDSSRHTGQKFGALLKQRRARRARRSG